MLAPGLSPELINQAIQALKEYQGAIMKAGEATQVDYKLNSNYANIIFAMGHLITELKNANCN
tara:strand:- start:5374 stop:5562 length:189 start_codon:yes stop_codon:yes gene_type:complete